jgi:hypothetical protein
MPTLSEPVLASFAVALIYGIVDDDKLETWLLLAGAILGVGTNGLASLHTSTHSPEQPEARDGDMDRGAIDAAQIFFILGSIILIGFIILWVSGRN